MSKHYQRDINLRDSDESMVVNQRDNAISIQKDPNKLYLEPLPAPNYFRAVEVGDRVGAILKSDDTGTIWLLGYGNYLGEQVPDPELGVSSWVMEAFGIDRMDPEPCIRLDSGQLVYGCECWWSTEQDIQDLLGMYKKVELADVDTERRAKVT